MDIPKKEPWQDFAACKGDLKLFYPVDKERINKTNEREASAKKICELCPVVQSCLEYALNNKEQGVWGGTTEYERFDTYGVKPAHAANTNYARRARKKQKS